MDTGALVSSALFCVYRPHPRPVGHPLSINGDGEWTPAARALWIVRGGIISTPLGVSASSPRQRRGLKRLQSISTPLGVSEMINDAKCLFTNQIPIHKSIFMTLLVKNAFFMMFNRKPLRGSICMVHLVSPQ